MPKKSIEVSAFLSQETIERKIYLLRNKKVMLDSELAGLYEVKTKELNRAVKRNLERFPDDFMFQLTEKEAEILRCQIGTSSWGGKRYLPHAFTEHGILMLSSILRSRRAIQVNIQIMRKVVFKAIKALLEKNEGPPKRFET